MSDFVVRHITPLELPQVADLIAQNFTDEDPRLYNHQVHRWIVSMIHQPDFQYAHHRVGVLNSRIVSHVLVKPFTLRYGTVDLRVGGIGVVCTHHDFRNQGYATTVMHDALAYMAEHGVHLAVLNGISHYYDRFGFNPVWPEYSFSVDSASAAALDQPLHLRPAKTRDIPAMAKLYKDHWGSRVTYTRKAELWKWRLMGEDRQYVKVVEDQSGTIHGYIAGYIATSPEIEVVVDNLEAAMTVLSEIGHLCIGAGIKQLEWYLPPDDAMVFFARQLLTVTVSARYYHRGGWMARIVDPKGLVKAILPEIIAHAQLTFSDLDSDKLIFNCLPDGVRIGLRGVKTTQCEIHYRDFIQVMFSSLRPAELAARPQSRLHLDGVQLLESLFPPRMAAIACWDWL